MEEEAPQYANWCRRVHQPGKSQHMIPGNTLRLNPGSERLESRLYELGQKLGRGKEEVVRRVVQNRGRNFLLPEKDKYSSR